MPNQSELLIDKLVEWDQERQAGRKVNGCMPKPDAGARRAPLPPHFPIARICIAFDRFPETDVGVYRLDSCALRKGHLTDRFSLAGLYAI